MRIGDLTGQISDEILNLEFILQKKINFLSLLYKITVFKNYVSCKIDKLVRFWDIFLKALPGKITV